MFQAIVAAVVAIPKLLTAVENLIELFKTARIEARLAAIESAFDKLDGAKTKEEKREGVRDIQSSM